MKVIFKPSHGGKPSSGYGTFIFCVADPCGDARAEVAGEAIPAGGVRVASSSEDEAEAIACRPEGETLIETPRLEPK